MLSQPLKQYDCMLTALWEWLLDHARTWKVPRDYWKMLFSQDQIHTRDHSNNLPV